MRDTMDQIMEELQESRTSEKKEPEKPRKKSYWGWIAVFFCLLIAVLAGIIFGVWYHRWHSAEYQLARAAECFQAQDYEQAVNYYLRSKELGNTDPEIDFALADCYNSMDNVGGYENQLLMLIESGTLDQGQLERAYAGLINSYRTRNDYQTIDSLLNACDNDSIKSKYQNFQAKPPK